MIDRTSTLEFGKALWSTESGLVQDDSSRMEAGSVNDKMAKIASISDEFGTRWSR